MSFDGKWGEGPPDDSIPPQIARCVAILSGQQQIRLSPLTSHHTNPMTHRLSSSGYQTFSDREEDLRLLSHDESGQPRPGRSFDGGGSFSGDLIGPGPEATADLESIKAAVSSLRPYILKKRREHEQSVQVLEIYATGESGYKSTMTLAELLVFVHKVASLDSGNTEDAGAAGDEGTSSSSREGGGGLGRVPSESKIASRKSEADLGGGGRGGGTGSSRFLGGGAREVQYHDLRHLETQFNVHEEPTILIRRHAILISLNPLRAIITANKILLIVPKGADALLYLLHDHMHGMVEDKEVNVSPAPELRFFHAIFSTAVSLHTQEYVHVCSRVEKVLQRFKQLKSVTIDVQEHIRILKNSVSSQYVKVNAYRRVLRELLDSPDDIALMNLSLLKEKPGLYARPLQDEILHSSEEYTILIESYLMDYNSLETKLAFLKAQITNAEELVRTSSISLAFSFRADPLPQQHATRNTQHQRCPSDWTRPETSCSSPTRLSPS